MKQTNINVKKADENFNDQKSKLYFGVFWDSLMITQRVKIIHNIKDIWITLKLHLPYGKIFTHLNMTDCFIILSKALHLHGLWSSSFTASIGMNRNTHSSKDVDSQPQSLCFRALLGNHRLLHQVTQGLLLAHTGLSEK